MRVSFNNEVKALSEPSDGLGLFSAVPAPMLISQSKEPSKLVAALVVPSLTGGKGRRCKRVESPPPVSRLVALALNDDQVGAMGEARAT